MKPVKIFVLALIAVFTFSCNANKDDGSGTGDAIVVCKKVGGNVVYGYSLYAYSFASFQSVEAANALDPGNVYRLKANQGYKTNFYYDTPDTEFTVEKPTPTTFHFSAVFENGVTDEFDDEVSDKVLLVPVIESTSYDSKNNETTVTWTTVSGANNYAVIIYEGTNPVFWSTELANTTKSLVIGSSTSSWISGVTPVVGKTYTVKVNAYLYEPNGNSYNVQAVSTTEKTIIWGQ